MLLQHVKRNLRLVLGIHPVGGLGVDLGVVPFPYSDK
jgi:hypothetical protein